MCVLHAENTNEPPRIDDRRQRSLSSLFTTATVLTFETSTIVREKMKTNDVRSDDIQRTKSTTVNDIFLTKNMKLEWPDKR